MSFRVGHLLIANPEMQDPNFFRTVVLLVAHGTEGSMGLILNRPLRGEVMRFSDAASFPIKIYEGGPVEKMSLHVLHRLPEELGGRQVTSGLYYGARSLSWSSLKEKEGLRLYLGYAGWAPGQLSQEWRAGAWFVLDKELDIFAVAPEKLYARALACLGPRYALLARMPVDVRLN
ncbi:MAG: YqgE/AlgH family protein [Bacteroidia bacterium]